MKRHPGDIQIADYLYDLSDDRIARYPLPERDGSKLLIYQKGYISESIYREIANHLPPDSLLVFNNTKVIHARLFFQTQSGAKVEVFCLEPADHQTDVAMAMAQKQSAKWNCMIGRASKWKEKVLELKTSAFILSAEIAERNPDAFVVEFRWTPDHLSFSEILEGAGLMPIPPYLKRNADEIDDLRYQTIFSEREGSVAAPTAGLHFTEKVFQSLADKKISTAFLALHVGAGTFKPVTSTNMREHNMHAEVISVGLSFLQQIKEALARCIIPVGTTSCRTLESLYWMGVIAKLNPASTIEELEIQQWEVYEGLPQDISAGDALDSLMRWMKSKSMDSLLCKTQILIAPGYKFRITSALVTNFHQPSSTLLLLVAAMVGEDWRKIYEYALGNNFRFLSYGDGSLIFPSE